MKNRILRIFLIIILCGVVFEIPVFAKETPDELKTLYARSAVLMDADSGRILFGKNENNVLPMASTTKIMTCILALENMEEEQICEVSEHAVRQPKVHLGVKTGEQYYLKDLLYSLMLESHNDSAVVIAESMAGSVEDFAKQMNKKANEIGCRNTYFITPNGLDAEDDIGVHSTTASDLALIMRYCIMESPVKDTFIKITQESSYEFGDVSGKRKFICRNHNAFLNMMEGALSGKTGFTNDAGYCYVGALRDGERTFIVALLACGWPNNKGYKWTDTRKLMEYGIENYEYRNIREEVVSEKILLLNGLDISEPFKKTIYVRTSVQNDSGNMQILLRQDEVIVVKTVQLRTIRAPAKKNQKVGKIFYMLEDEVITSFDIVLEETIKRRTYILDLNILIREILL